MEVLSVAIGTVAAKLALRLWAQEDAVGSIGSDVIDIFGGRVNGHLAQRQVRRQVENIADQIAERLSPFLSAEVGGIEPHELEAATLAAEESLERASATDLGILFSLDLDSAQLAKAIRVADQEAVARAGLGDAASGVYDTLISECATYITRISSQLPGFATREAQELLGRQSKLADLSREILESLPTSVVPREWGRGSEDERFENKYRVAIREYADQLQLFGVVPDEARRAYPLSVAYISMSVDEVHISMAGTEITRSAKEGRADAEDVKVVPDSLRVEALLEDSDRLLLTGGAGSGKTTLIQWMALSAVQDEDDVTVPSGWGGRFPFIIPLRRFVGRDLPTPGQWVSQIAPNLAEAMPSSWVHRVLASGRGIVLIDGLDEIPQTDREDARKWVLQLVRDFPDNKFLVTSRTTAITKGWREEQSFRHAELLPMEYTDIRSFVAHWHEATSYAVDRALQPEVLAAEKSLLTIVRDRSAIRALCTSPLLCALICALHLQNASSLPNNRMDLYRTALEMLIHKRDNDRKVRLSPAEIDISERLILLRSFAGWLHENGAADATRVAFDDRISRAAAQLHRVKGEASEIAAFMLERSGVLREPVAGRVDFVHRTFLEYLAAAEIVDDDSIDKLIRAAHDDHWREVIIMAAGHANSGQRERLLSGLLNRGEETPRRRHRMFLLAVACMETSPQLPEDLRARLEDALREVLPPRTMTQAASVASAGELAVPLLGSFSARTANVAAASVRALSLIGGDEALRQIESYRTDRRVTVTRQLIRAWSSFDTADYARQVLADSSLDRGHITVTDADQIAQLPLLRNAKSVYVSLPRSYSSVRDVPVLPDRLSGVELTGLTDVNSIADLKLPTSLRSLSLRNASLRSLGGIEELERLRFLSLSGCAMLTDVRDLQSINASFVNLSGVSIADLAIGGASGLEWIQFHTARVLRDISEPVPTRRLFVGWAPTLETASGLASSAELRELNLHLGNLRDLELPAGLEYADLTSWESFPVAIGGGEGLRSVSISASIEPTTLDWLCGLRNVSTLEVTVRNLEIGGWSPATAVAELCAKSPANRITVSVPYGARLSLPTPLGWERAESVSRVTYTRSN